MKKIKIISFIVLVLLCVVLLFANCKKTSALEKPYFQGSRLNITSLDTNSVFFGIYEINENSINEIPFQMDWITQGGGNYAYIGLSNYDTNNYSLNYVIGGNGTMSNIIIEKDKALYYYVVVGGNQTQQNSYELAIQFGFIYIYKNGLNSYIDYSFNNYYYSNVSGQEQDEIFDSYNTSNIGIYPLSQRTDTAITCVYNFYILDMLDYQTLTFSEYVEDIKDEYIKISDNYLELYKSGYTAGYQAGYQAGYNEGYDDGYDVGYTAGQQAGYQAGYTAGEQAGYEGGYTEGHAVGYSSGYNAGLNDNVAGQQIAYNAGYEAGKDYGETIGYLDGYDDGYDEGYGIGYNEGFGGATPMSRATTLIGSIFGAIGSVLSIQLFPGFTLGLLILVPLFFAVLGLILWIWRRN